MSAVRRQSGEQPHAAFLVLKLLGAVYLIYLGLRQLLARKASVPSLQQPTPNTCPASWRVDLGAFLVSASNPKALVFFCAFLP